MTEGAGDKEGATRLTFFYHRSLAPMMWVLFALIVIETAIVHLLVALWAPRAAVLLSLLAFPLLAWVMLLIRSFRARPVTIADGMLHWPAGRLRAVTVPLAQVNGLRRDLDGPMVKARTTFNAALIAYPNMVVELSGPVTLGRRQVLHLAHKLDDTEAFVAAMARLSATA